MLSIFARIIGLRKASPGHVRSLCLAALLGLAFWPSVARALPQCRNDTLTCVLNGKIGEKFCTNGGWSACRIPGGGGVPSGPDPRCSDRNATGMITCIVNQPDVRQHETNYPMIVFAPNDTVYVSADGCVQSGGWGSTWHRYANPTGPDADHLYHGLIRIPTGTLNSALVRIGPLIEQPITVTGAGVDVSTLFLHLGFEDSDYSDNGYDNHDDGPDDKCSYANGGYPAIVAITIFRGVKPVAPVSRFDFDVVGINPPDANGLSFNPVWSWQLKFGNAGKMPDTSTCHNFSERNFPYAYLSPSFADCTDQADAGSVDIRQMCQLSGQLQGGGFGGHVNWFPITVQGSAFWGDHSAIYQQIFGDDDYNFSFVSGQPGNPLSLNGRPGLHVEFDSDETIDHFTGGEWPAFHSAVDANNDTLAQQYFDGFTILTGMFGIDTDHMKAELHPLFAIATRRDTHGFENGAGDEAWLMFVRNVGDEGFCSYKLWSAEFEEYTFRLPWRDGMSRVEVNWANTSFDGTDGTSGPIVHAVAPTFPRNPGSEGVFVTFHLGPVAGAPFVDGTLHLIWGGPVAEASNGRLKTIAGAVRAGSPVRSAGGAPFQSVIVRPGEDEEADDMERKLSAAVQKLTPAQRATIGTELTGLPKVGPATHRLAHGSMVVDERATIRPTLLRMPMRTHPHAVSVGQATAKLTRDAVLLRALCSATNNAPSGLPAQICSANVLAGKP